MKWLPLSEREWKIIVIVWVVILLVLILAPHEKEKMASSNEVDTTERVDLASIIWEEPSLDNPLDITFSDDCRFKIAGPNEIRATCTYQEFVSALYYLMTYETSDNVVLNFADGDKIIKDGDKVEFESGQDKHPDDPTRYLPEIIIRKAP